MAFLDTSNLKGDVFGGLTAGIVALPLALAFGEASGAGPIAGLWGAILVGFFASLFGGTGPQVTGPTGPMVVVFAGVYSSLAGDPALVFTSVVLAGGLLILMGVMGVGRYIRLVPYPVVSGFMSGIGCIIIALQLSRLFGHEPADTGTIPALVAVPGAVMAPNMWALLLGLATLAIVFTWPAKLGKFMPGPLAALIICSVAGLALPGVPVLGDIPTGLPDFVMPTFSQDTLFVVFEGAIILAALCGIDSLLTSLVSDNITRTRHDSNKELIGQGIGNTVAGLFGAIPGAGATMRTVVNIRTGGSTKISGMIHALLLLAVVLALSPLASQIPHTVLAGILIKVGYDIIDWRYLMHAHRGPRWDLALMALVLVVTVFVDLITAVALGVVLAALAFVKEIADLQLASLQSNTDDVNDEETARLLKSAHGRVTLFDFSGPLSFGAAADLGHHVRERSSGDTSVVIMDFSHVPHLDVSAAKAVETIAEDANDYGRSLYITGANDKVKGTLSALEITRLVPTDHWFSERIAALQAAIAELGDAPGGVVPQPG